MTSATDNRTTERIDHPPRVRKAIDELMRKKDATSNRTTELREKLTERGVEYTTNDHMGVCETSWNGFTAMQLTPNAKLIMVVTPEQAIAATLGYELNPDGLPAGLTISDNGALLNWRGENYVKQGTLGNGTLTVEQVEDIVYRNTEFYEGGDVDVHAIADELNDMLGSDDEYEAKMDALLCRLTNGKWSKSRAYDLDFMVSCIEEEFEAAELENGTYKRIAELEQLIRNMYYEHPIYYFEQWMEDHGIEVGE